MLTLIIGDDAWGSTSSSDLCHQAYTGAARNHVWLQGMLTWLSTFQRSLWVTSLGLIDGDPPWRQHCSVCLPLWSYQLSRKLCQEQPAAFSPCTSTCSFGSQARQLKRHNASLPPPEDVQLSSWFSCDSRAWARYLAPPEQVQASSSSERRRLWAEKHERQVLSRPSQ